MSADMTPEAKEALLRRADERLRLVRRPDRPNLDSHDTRLIRDLAAALRAPAPAAPQQKSDGRPEQPLPSTEPGRPPLNAPGNTWKVGNEFLPFHPDASHVPPDYRDGWNACYRAASAAPAAGPPAKLNPDAIRLTLERWLQELDRLSRPSKEQT